MLRPCVCICIGGRTTLCALRDCVRTSASNFLYSSSLDALYSSISFLASSRASLTRFVLYSRAVHQQVSVSSARRCGCSRVGCCSWGFRTLLDDLGGVFLGLWLLSAKFESYKPDNCGHTSRRVWIPAEFWADCDVTIVSMSPPRQHSGRRRTGEREPCWRTFRVCRKQIKETVSDMLKRESIVGPSWGEGGAKC